MNKKLDFINPSQQQLDIIQQQLGRMPEGMAGIAVQSKQEIPLVLQMRSLVNNKPFPTLYWLCSRDLYRAIARIETSGIIKQLEQQLQSDSSLRNQHLADQQRYINLRAASLSKQQKEQIESLGFSLLYKQYGIGGIRQWDRIRCLHMHYAYHLAQGSTIGAILDKEYQLDQLRIAL